MRTILSQPFPGYKTPQMSLRFYLIAGAIVFLMLSMFRPFGLDRIESSYFLLHTLLYGLGTFVFASLNGILGPLLFPTWFEEENWTVAREGIMMLWHLCVISLVNWAITHYLYGAPPAAITSFVVYTVALGIFPVGIIILLKYILLLKRNQQKAEQTEQALIQYIEDDIAPVNTIFTLNGEGNKETLTLSVDELLYIEAADNYIKVFFLEADRLTSKMLRSSLKKAEQTLVEHAGCFRCHRTYLVNLHKVEHVTGNAQGLKLQLQHTSELIPVSRSLQKTLLERLAGKHSTPITPETA